MEITFRNSASSNPTYSSGVYTCAHVRDMWRTRRQHVGGLRKKKGGGGRKVRKLFRHGERWVAAKWDVGRERGGGEGKGVPRKKKTKKKDNDDAHLA